MKRYSVFLVRWIGIAILAVALAGCGGGSGGKRLPGTTDAHRAAILGVLDELAQALLAGDAARFAAVFAPVVDEDGETLTRAEIQAAFEEIFSEVTYRKAEFSGTEVMIQTPYATLTTTFAWEAEDEFGFDSDVAPLRLGFHYSGGRWQIVSWSVVRD